MGREAQKELVLDQVKVELRFLVFAVYVLVVGLALVSQDTGYIYVDNTTSRESRAQQQLQ